MNRRTNLTRAQRTTMRDYALLYRQTLDFGRRYYGVNQAVYERWAVMAGEHLHNAKRMRDWGTVV